MAFKGSLAPNEFIVVQGVFKRVARESWFKDDIPTLNRFGSIVVHAYQSGMVEDEHLFAHCMQVAKERFVEPPTTAK